MYCVLLFCFCFGSGRFCILTFSISCAVLYFVFGHFHFIPHSDKLFFFLNFIFAFVYSRLTIIAIANQIFTVICCYCLLLRPHVKIDQNRARKTENRAEQSGGEQNRAE